MPESSSAFLRHDAVMERINPATLLVAAVLMSLPLILTLDWVSASTSLLLEVLLLLGLGVRPGPLARRALVLLVVAPLGAVSMVLYGKVGGHVWWQWGPWHVSDNSLRMALAGFLRIFALAIPSIGLFSGIDATRMADGLAQVLHLPARFVLGCLAGFRTIGVFTTDWRVLAQARRARGLGDDGRLRRWAMMSFSLLVLALRRGTRLATAMEAKGFGGSTPRTWARPSRVGLPDAVLVAVSLAIGILPLWLAHRLGILSTAF